MKILWDEEAWSDYLYWQTQDKKTLRRINQLIRDIQRDPFGGMGKPEPLKWKKSGCWSCRIDSKNRLLYRIADEHLEILQCRTHYDEK